MRFDERTLRFLALHCFIREATDPVEYSLVMRSAVRFIFISQNYILQAFSNLLFHHFYKMFQ
jgi:hypothetical protein